MIGRGAKPAANVRQRLGHPLDELVAAALLDQQARVAALERLDHHQLGAQQADAVDVERGGALDLGRLGEVDQQLRGGDGGRAAGDGGRARESSSSPTDRHRALADDAVGRVDGDELAVAQLRGRVAGADDARDARARARRSPRGRSCRRSR